MIIQNKLFVDLLKTFDLAQGQNPDSLSKEINLCDVPVNLKLALIN